MRVENAVWPGLTGLLIGTHRAVGVSDQCGDVGTVTGKVAMPILADVESPLLRWPRLYTSSIFSADTKGFGIPLIFSEQDHEFIISTQSATVSAARTASRMRPATARVQASPGVVRPRLSLIFFEVIEVDEHERELGRRDAASSIACSSLHQHQPVRQSVSGSWWAR